VPATVWQSSEIPSDHYGGHGSPVIADGRVFLTLVWHRDVPTDTPEPDGTDLRRHGGADDEFLPEPRAKFEADRLSLSPRLRGTALDEWIKAWMDANMDQKQKLLLDGRSSSASSSGNGDPARRL